MPRSPGPLRARGLDQALRRLSRAADFSKLWLGSASALAAFGGEQGRRAACNGIASLALTSALVNVVLKPLWGRRRPERVEHRVPFAPRVRMPKTRSFPSDTRIRFRLRDWRGERGAGTWRPAHRTRRTRRLLARAYGSALPLGHRSRRRHRRLALADRGGRRQALSSRGTLTRSARGRIENRSGGASSIASPSTPACTVDGASTSRERAFHARPGERRCRGGASMTMIPRRPPSSFGRAPRASGRSSA
jgi:hypothetical protein